MLIHFEFSIRFVATVKNPQVYVVWQIFFCDSVASIDKVLQITVLFKIQRLIHMKPFLIIEMGMLSCAVDSSDISEEVRYHAFSIHISRSEKNVTNS